MTKQVEFRGLLPYLYYEDAGSHARLALAVDQLPGPPAGELRKGRALSGKPRRPSARTSSGFWPRPGYWESKGGRPDVWIGVWVDDVDAMYERVKAAGIESEPPEDKDYDVRSYSVKDPGRR